MADKYFRGGATAVAGVQTITVTAVSGTPSDTTYTVGLVNSASVGVYSVAVVGDTDVNTTATNIATAWNAETHPYMAAVTAAANTDTITFTADTAGVPFSVGASAAGGTGTISATTTVTASAGPNDFSTAANWDASTLPQANDVVHIKGIATNICWGLDALDGTALDGFIVHDTYTGKIGLDWATFATSADGATSSSTAVTEYRDTYLQIDVTQTDGAIEIGKVVGPSLSTGSSRVMIDATATTADIIVHSTAATSADSGRPAVRLKAASASTDVYVLSATGGVGVAADAPDETATIGVLNVSGANSRVLVGPGTQLATVKQSEGSTRISGLASAGDTITTVTVGGGTFRTEGQMDIGTMHQYGGTTYLNHVSRDTVEVTTLNLRHGTCDATGTINARTWTTVNLDPDNAKLIWDDATLTITNKNFTQNDALGKV